jgi:two-component system, OmpR family, copper resistance phosphate regulon response regulator CusR
VARILIVEDDALVSSFIEKGLRASGYSTHVVADGGEAVPLALTQNFDLLILDMALPTREGFEVLREIRRQGNEIPVIVLTGRPEMRDVVSVLDVGADDYMTKPFRFEELLARVRARLRAHGTEEVTVLTAGTLRLDLRARRALVGGDEVPLTAREFALLETFMRHPGQVLSREQLLSHVWGYFFDPGSNLVNVYVSSLRHKLGEGVIQTVRGAGYRLQPQ